MPKLYKRMWNFTKAIWYYSIGGFKNVNPNEYVRRLDICSPCENNIKGICDECGCILKLKARWKSENCPIDKWNKEKKEDV